MGFKLLRHVILSAFITIVVVSILFPQLYIDHDVSFIRFQDSEFTYYGLFTLISNMYHGGIQLWNNYDQMPLTYYYMVGMVSIPHLIATAFYYPLALVFGETSQYYYEHYVYFYYGLLTIIRTVGFYLLARLFSTQSIPILLSTVLVSTVMNPYYYLGLNCTALYSLFPFVIYFWIRFVTVMRFNDLIWFAIALSVSLALDPLVGVGYFYLPIHFLIVSSIAWILIFRKQRFFSELRRMKNRKYKWKNALVPVLALLFIACLFAPLIILMKSTYSDYELAHSNSRFAHLFSVSAYFNKTFFQTPVSLYLPNALDFEKPAWAYEWMFLGWLPIFLIAGGLIISTDRRRWIFFAGFLLLLSVQLPAKPFSIVNIGHWITVLTNPFNSTLRTFHMPGAFLSPAMLFPLVVLGADRLFLFMKGQLEVANWRFNSLLGCMILVAVNVLIMRGKTRDLTLSYLVTPVTVYVLVGCSLICLAMLIARRYRTHHWASLASLTLLGILLALDWHGLGQYLRRVGVQITRVEHTLPGMDKLNTPARLDLQNPLELPYFESYLNSNIDKIKPYLQIDPHNMQGLFYHFTNLAKFFAPLNQYLPRHKAYAPLANCESASLCSYVSSNSNLSAYVAQAVNGGANVLKDIMSAGLQNDVVAIDDYESRLPSLGELPAKLPTQTFKSFGCQNYILPFESFLQKASESNYRVLTHKLPEGFPRYLASSVFVDDHMEIFSTSPPIIKFTPAQGEINRIYQYDVANVRTRTLTISLPSNLKSENIGEINVNYCPTAPLNNLNLITNEPDHQSFKIDFKREGWLIMHIPYDKKWSISLDGESTRFYRANEAFVSLKVPAGSRQLDIRYWPNSLLRASLLLSYISCFIGFLLVIRKAITLL